MNIQQATRQYLLYVTNSYIIMKLKIITLVGAGIIPFVTGCISNPMALAPVGPDASSRAVPGMDKTRTTN
jgi:hypothetical protein